MFVKLITRLLRRKSAESINPYTLPSDDPAVSPILVEEHEEIPAEEVICLNSRLLAPVDPANLSARSRAVVEIKSGLNDLGQHIRMLGQRLHAQSMGQAKLIEALSGLPDTLKNVLPNVEEQNRALGALKLAMDEQALANRTFVEALKPLPEFVQAAASLPEAAKQQVAAISELTQQLQQGNTQQVQQSEEVRIMVQSLAAGTDARAGELKTAVSQMTKVQQAQLKQASQAVKSAELTRLSQRRHQIELQRTQQSRLNAIARDNARNFNQMQEQFRRSARTQGALTGIAALLAIAAIVFAALAIAGVFTPTQQTAATDPAPRTVDSSAVVSR